MSVCEFLKPSPGVWWRCSEDGIYQRMVRGQVRWYCNLHRSEGEPVSPRPDPAAEAMEQTA